MAHTSPAVHFLTDAPGMELLGCGIGDSSVQVAIGPHLHRSFFQLGSITQVEYEMKGIARFMRFFLHLYRQRSFSLALWVDQYENHTPSHGK